MAGGFASLPEGAGGTGEGGLAPTKEGNQFRGSIAPEAGNPMAHMGSLTGLIKVALQSTTNEIHLNISNGLRHELQQFRQDIEGKANKSELVALTSRLDAWAQRSSRARERGSVAMSSTTPSRSPEKSRHLLASTVSTVIQMNNSANMFRGSCARELSISEDDMDQAPPGKARKEPLSPSKKFTPAKEPTCHERCKEPTCPRALQMSQSLSKLPPVKSAIA